MAQRVHSDFFGFIGISIFASETHCGTADDCISVSELLPFRCFMLAV